MKRRIVFTTADYDAVRSHVLKGGDEEAAVCLGGHVASDELVGILVREVHPVPEESLVTHHGAFVEIDPVWLAAKIKQARHDDLSVVVVHSHPFARRAVRFSTIDTGGQERLIPKLQARVPGVPHAEMVFGQESVDALVWAAEEREPDPVDEVRVIGEAVVMLPTSRTKADAPTLAPENDRQVRFLGEEGQQRMGSLKVGVVGAGGNGAPIVMQLTHLGVGQIVTADPDVLDASNRNRIPDAGADDDGSFKVDVARRYAARVRPGAKVIPIYEPIEMVWSQLRDCDVIFGATDDLSSRLVLNRLATQYMIPLIDTGVEIEVVDEKVRTIAGRVNVVRPGSQCLEGLGFTNEEAAERELANRRPPGYVDDDPAASAMPANLLVASLAGIEFLKLIHGLFGGCRADRYFAYSGRSGELRSCATSARRCGTCEQFAGVGDARPVPLIGPIKERRSA